MYADAMYELIIFLFLCQTKRIYHIDQWGEDRENPRDEPCSLDLALARSRREVHPEGFPILTSSTWLNIYLAYLLPKPHFNHMFFGLQSIWHIYRVGKCRLTSPSDVITTCVGTHSRTSNGLKRRQEGFPIIMKSKRFSNLIHDIEITYMYIEGDGIKGTLYDLSSVDHVLRERQVTWWGKDKVSYHCQIRRLSSPIGKINKSIINLVKIRLAILTLSQNFINISTIWTGIQVNYN